MTHPQSKTTTTQQHTAGPWKVSECPTDRTVRVVTATPGLKSTVCDCGPVGYGAGDTWSPDTEAMATARLIAAAPDMLSFLVNLRDEVAGGEDASTLKGWIADVHSEVVALIAKATGAGAP